MKNTFAFVSAIAGLAAAQQFDIAAINAAPAPSLISAPVLASGEGVMAYNSSAAAASASADAEPTQAANSKRDSCPAQPAGTGPSVHNPDTAQAFEDNPYFAATSNAQVSSLSC
jgi:hypothetical protein